MMGWSLSTTFATISWVSISSSLRSSFSGLIAPSQRQRILSASWRALYIDQKRSSSICIVIWGLYPFMFWIASLFVFTDHICILITRMGFKETTGSNLFIDIEPLALDLDGRLSELYFYLGVCFNHKFLLLTPLHTGCREGLLFHLLVLLRVY